MIAAYKAATAVAEAQPAPRSKLRLAAIGFATAFGLVLPAAAVRTQSDALHAASGGMARVAARIARAVQARGAPHGSPPHADAPSDAAAATAGLRPPPLPASAAQSPTAPSTPRSTRAAPARVRTADSWKSTIF
jgi:hypothetical protein